VTRSLFSLCGLNRGGPWFLMLVPLTGLKRRDVYAKFLKAVSVLIGGGGNDTASPSETDARVCPCKMSALA